MLSRDEIRSAVIRVGGVVVDHDDLADAIANEVLKLLESRETKQIRVMRATETRMVEGE